MLRKLILAFFIFVFINMLVLNMGMGKNILWFSSNAQIFLAEVFCFIIYQILLLLAIKIKPLKQKKQKIFIFISESMFTFTVIFWMFIIVGPFWEHL